MEAAHEQPAARGQPDRPAAIRRCELLVDSDADVLGFGERAERSQARSDMRRRAPATASRASAGPARSRRAGRGESQRRTPPRRSIRDGRRCVTRS